MEPVIKQAGKVMGVEVLCFPDAEIRKMKGDSTSFAASGPLSVLYFKDYHRFMLHLHNWKYPLMRRLPVTPSGKEDMGSRSYTFPALNGYSYELRINHAGNNNAMTNFETILSHNCNFASSKDEHRKLEASPDDKLVRHIKKDTTTMDVISETTKHVAEKAKIKTETFKHGTKHLTSTKKRMHLKDIKNKNFKKTAHSTFKKDFFQAGEKMSQEFMRLRRENPNMSGTMDIDSLRKTSEGKAPVVYLWKEEVEEAILNNKDLISRGNFVQSNVGQGMVEEKKGFIQSIRQGLTNIKDSIASRIESRTTHAPEMKPQEATVEHYQG